MSDPRLDTAAQRPATGLDRGARILVLHVLEEQGWSWPVLVGYFFKDAFGGREDYFDAVEQVRGFGARDALARGVMHAEVDASYPVSSGGPSERDAGLVALLLAMPEADFRSAVAKALDRDAAQAATKPPHRRASQPAAEEPGDRVNRILTSRGAPWRFARGRGFEWVGDEVVEQRLLRPALSALNDRRLAGGVRAEFDSARSELALDTPVSRKQAIGEAASGVESAMKVVLGERGLAFDPTATAQKLFERLVEEGVVPRWMERAVLPAATPRNKSGGHGAGAVAHDVAPVEAQAVVAAAAGAIVYLASKLP